jgi:hypothetical protein
VPLTGWLIRTAAREFEVFVYKGRLMPSFQDSLKIPETLLRRHYFGGNQAVIVLAVCTLFGALFLIFGYLFLKVEPSENKKDIPTTARVTDKYRRYETQKDSQGETQTQTIYWVRYKYENQEGRTYEGKTKLEAGDWDRLQKGDTLAAEYERDYPENGKIVLGHSVPGRKPAIVCLVAGTIFCAGSGFMGIGGWLGAVRRARRVRDGVSVKGEVIDRVARTFPRFGDFVQYRLEYRFTDADGTERNGKTIWLPRNVACRFAAGDSIQVLYYPDLPSRHEADVFEARMIAI